MLKLSESIDESSDPQKANDNEVSALKLFVNERTKSELTAGLKSSLKNCNEFLNI